MNSDVRKLLENRVLEDLVNSAMNDGSWIRDIMRSGYPGVAHMSDSDLLQAYSDAGLEEQYDGDLNVDALLRNARPAEK